MEIRIFVFLGLLSLAYCVTEEDFYPFDRVTDERLPNGDSTSSHKIALRVPAKFYDTEYDYVWINIDGYISFEPDLTEKSQSDFPFDEALLSPFMSDLDTTRRGEIYYRESNDAAILSKANDDIRSAFPRAAAGFDAESVFIVTWHGVEGRTIDGTIARFTFQCIIVSNGRDSYAIFLYPEKKMGQVPAGVRMKSALFQARAGFNQGRKQFLEMYPVESLVDHRNGRRKGEWIYQIGGEGVRTNKEVIAPERVRPVKRQTTVLNVQEVNLTEEEDDNYITTSNERRVYDYCSHDADACLANNSQCVNYDNGYCCRCLPEFYGNGKVCVGNQDPISVNGNVSGVVDVKEPDGSINRQSVNDVTFHSYMMTSDGRAYTAISNVSPVLGRALQPISPIGEIVGWLFAVPTTPAVNGFQFTGGNFQRQVSIRYENSDYKFDLRQRFMGVRSEGNANMVVGHTTFVGFLPSIPDGAPVTMESYEDEYVKQAPGRFSSTSVRTYTVNNQVFRYTINQAIIFNECRDSLSSVPDTLILSVSDAFLNYHDDDDNVRYAMNSRISASGSLDPSHPCSTGAHNCDVVIAQCEPLVGSEYTCQCRDGYAGNGRVCEDIDECVENRCGANQECLNSAGSYSCVCRGGFQLNSRGECEVTCPSNQVYSTCAGCFKTCEERSRPRACTRQCRQQCTCPEELPYLVGDTCVSEQQCSGARTCPGNQVFSRCAGCSTTCEERFAPKVCTLQCRQQCTCPENLPYLNGDMCVTDDQCPRPTDSSVPICTLRNNQATNWLLEHPNEQTPPSFFDCDSNGLFEKRQCNDQTDSCWCVEPSTGTRIEGTEELSSCEPCIEKNVEIQNFIRNNPGIQDGPEMFRCDDYGLFEKEQCGGFFTVACWCVNPRNGTRIGGVVTDGRANCETSCPGNQVFSTCAGCSTTCDERFAPKVCTLQCRQECTCPGNLPYLNGDMCVAAEQCPPPRVTCPSNQVFSTCAGCFKTCEERSRPRACTRQCRQQCTCPEELPYLVGDTCVSEQQCSRRETCPGNQVFSTCAGCSTTCDERFAPKVCTLQCRQECTCPENLPYLNGDMCVAAEQCPPPRVTCPSNQVYSTCAGCFKTCEERSRPRACTRQCRQQCTCPEELPYLVGDTCVSEQQCSRRETCPGNQVFSTCAGCSTTCDERFAPKVCTLQCRQKCTCPENLPYLNGDMCVAAEQCPPPRVTCPSNQVFSTCAGCFKTCEERSRPRACTRQCRQQCTCPEELPYLVGDTCVSEQQCSRRETCPGNQVFSTCAGCSTTCDERFAPKVCTLQCRQKCTCPENLPYLNGDMCVTDDQCPTPPNQADGPCTIEYNRQLEWLSEHPGVLDGPDFPECTSDGYFESKQCNDFTRVCWCVDTRIGTHIPGTEGKESCDSSCPGNQVFSTCAECVTTCAQRFRPPVCDRSCHRRCSCPQDAPYLNDGVCLSAEQCPGSDPNSGPCTQRRNEVMEWQRQHPNIADGPDYPECDEDGLYRRTQCNDLTGICWCVDPLIGSMIAGTSGRENCDESSPVPLTLCQRMRQEAERLAENRPDVFQPICTEAGAFEPIQYHVEGYYTCIDINGEELSRHFEQPECLTACQLQAYYAETDNNLLGTEKFVPQCTEDGRFSSIQCDQASQSCYCADQNGQEISGTRESTSGGSPNYLECPDNNQPSVPNRPVQLLIANTRSINAIDLPVSVTSTARRLFSRSGRMAIGIAFDCSSQKIYWTDVATRAIYMSPLSDPSSPTVIVSGLRSPEGIAVDFITGNIFWTDSGLDRIEVASADGSYRAVLISTGLRNPRGIAVDPFGGKMYWTDWDRQNPRIMRANMDGTEIEVFLQEDLTLPNNLAIDPFFRRLCFIDDAKIKCMNMDKSGLETVWTNTAMGKPFDLAVNGHKLYYSNRIRSSTTPSRIKRIYAVDTASLISTPLSGPLGEHGNVFGVAIASTSCPTGYNGCFRGNGGCRNLCLPVPNGKTCKCPDNDPSCQ